MKREIKFRVWDGKKIISLSDDNKRNYLTLGLTWEARDKNDKVIASSNDGVSILMQFTGLKDINGREIYEGDIIKLEGVKEQITFRNGCLYFGNENLVWVLGCVYGTDSYNECGLPDKITQKILGNIYENPNLLK